MLYDNTFNPGSFQERIDDFGFLWFEDEYVIDIASRWILAANAANALVNETQARASVPAIEGGRRVIPRTSADEGYSRIILRDAAGAAP